MNDQTSQNPRDREDDLSEYSSGGRSSTESPDHDFGFHEAHEDNHDDLMSHELPHSIPETKVKKGFSTKEKLMMGGVIFLVVILLSALVYFAYSWYTAKNQPRRMSNQSAQFMQQQNSPSLSSGAKSSLQDAESLASALGDSNGLDTALSASHNSEPPVNQGGQLIKSDTQSFSEQSKPLAAPPISSVLNAEPNMAPARNEAEERAYDDIVDQASKLNVPGSAIKIDDNVIKQTLASQEASIAETSNQADRKQMAELKAISSELQTALKTLSTSVENVARSQQQNMKDQERLSANISNMASELKALQGSVASNKDDFNSKINDLSKAVSNNKIKPVIETPKPQAVAKAATAEPRKPTPQPVTKTEAQVINVQLPPPQVVVTQTAPNYEDRQTAPAKCSASAVSSVWRVKGINQTSAYIVRPQDGQGMIVRKDEMVPGFGTAVSFDRYNRQVCTSSGLISR